MQNALQLDSLLSAAVSPLRLSRPQWALGAFRLVSGAAIAVYFLDLLQNAVDLIGKGGLYDEISGGAGALVVQNARWLANTSPAALRVLFAVAAGAAVVMAVGILPRVLSGLLLLLVMGTQRALLPVGNLDDYLTAAMLFWLVLLPATRDNVLTSAFWRSAGSPVGAGILPIFIAYVLLLYLVLGLGLLETGTPHWNAVRWPLIACCLMPAILVAPGPLGRALGTVAQVGVHGYLLATTGLVVTHLLLVATGFVLWTKPQGESGALDAQPVRVSAAFVVGCMYTALLSCVQFGSALAPARSRLGIAQFLSDAGLLPGGGEALPPGLLALEVQIPGQAPQLEKPRQVRAQSLLKRLSAVIDDATPGTLNVQLARHTFERFCTPGDFPQQGSARVILPTLTATEWLFTCSMTGALLDLTPPTGTARWLPVH